MLVELLSEGYATVSRSFGPAYPNLAFVHGVIEGRLPGRVWAAPAGEGFKACLICTEAPFCFAAGAIDPETLDEMLALVKTRPPVTLVYPAGLDVSGAAATHGFVEGERLQLSAAQGLDTASEDIEVPQPFRLVRIDGELFRRSNWRDMVHAIFGSADNYLSNHYGFGLLLEGRLVAEAHGVVGGGLVEIGTYTIEEYRRTGLSSIVCSEVKRQGARLGLRAVATCDILKIATIALTHRIGLQDDFRYGVLCLPA